VDGEGELDEEEVRLEELLDELTFGSASSSSSSSSAVAGGGGGGVDDEELESSIIVPAELAAATPGIEVPSFTGGFDVAAYDPTGTFLYMIL